MKLRGDRHTLHTCKMEGGGRTDACPWWEGMHGGEGSCPPPIENEKKKGVKRNFNLFHLYFTSEIREGGGVGIHVKWGWADRRLSMVGK